LSLLRYDVQQNARDTTCIYCQIWQVAMRFTTKMISLRCKDWWDPWTRRSKRAAPCLVSRLKVALRTTTQNTLPPPFAHFSSTLHPKSTRQYIDGKASNTWHVSHVAAVAEASACSLKLAHTVQDLYNQSLPFKLN
jgi:hypothetical protein